MKLPWTYTKAFGHKSFEQSSKNTSNSAPVQSQNVIVPEPEVLLSPKIILPPPEPVIEVVVPVEKPIEEKQGEKDVPEFRRSHPSQDREH